MKAKVCFAMAGLLLIPSIGWAQEACPVTTYEAESMFHSTGGSAPGGWNIWSNGYISTTHNFDGGSKVVSVVARGQAAAGVSPHMNVYVDGVLEYSYSILNTDWGVYNFNLDVPAGPHELRIEFDNDFNQGGQDRNLFIDKLTVGCGGGWTNLTLRNGWRAAADSNVPAVGLVDGIVTFRGALDGTQATSNTAFCLTDGHVTSTGPDYTQYRPVDVGWLTTRAALANGASGSLTLSIGIPRFDPTLPDTEVDGGYCMIVSQHGAGFEIGEDAEQLTSLEGVTYTKSARGVPQDAIKLESENWFTNYPERGTDGGLPGGQGFYAKVVNGFVRFQGTAITPGTEGQPLPKLFTLPSGLGLIPGNPVYVPVTLSPLGDSQPGRLRIQPNGDVFVEGFIDSALGGVALDGAAYSMSSPPSAVAITLANNWSASTSRAVRARLANGVVRLEGMVRNGSNTTLGTLPAGMRPARTIYVVAEAPVLDRDSILRINASGTIEIVYPSLLESQVGISLDGVSFAIDASSFQCTGACQSATPLARNQSSGAFGTTRERWFVVSTNINGWQASEMAGRTIRVNGVLVTPGQMPLPPAVNGSYYFQFSAGSFNWASWSFW